VQLLGQRATFALRVAQVPDSLDWISYDFYRLSNVSWLQPMCEYHQNLYPRWASNIERKKVPHREP
jgi:hypothetical protein